MILLIPVLGLGFVIFVNWYYYKYCCTPPEYQFGPRGGRYTIEDSYDGGEYKRYR